MWPSTYPYRRKITKKVGPQKLRFIARTSTWVCRRSHDPWWLFMEWPFNVVLNQSLKGTKYGPPSICASGLLQGPLLRFHNGFLSSTGCLKKTCITYFDNFASVFAWSETESSNHEILSCAYARERTKLIMLDERKGSSFLKGLAQKEHSITPG